MKKKPPSRLAYSAPSAVPLLIEVLRLIAKGYTNARIGTVLGITEHTVKCRARALYQHLGARDRAHAVAIGYRQHILRVPVLGSRHESSCALLKPQVCDCQAGS